MTIEVGFIEAVTTNHARMFRRTYTTLAGKAGVGGVSDLDVTQHGAGANPSVDVAAGLVFVAGTEGTRPGMYAVHSDGVANVSVPVGDPTNPRIDLIVARIKDNEYADGADIGTIERVAGTPAGSPVEPTVPANSFVLARIDVPAGASSVTNTMITERRVLCGAASASRGLIKHVQLIQTGPGIGGTTATVNGSTLSSIVTEAGRTYRMSLLVHIQSTGASDNFVFQARRDGSQIGPDMIVDMVRANQTITTNFEIYDTPSAGTHTYDWGVRNAGPGTGTILGNGRNAIEDVGSLSLP